MDFRAQRYRDRLRAEGRTIAIRTARRTRDILDGYVGSRRGIPSTDPMTEILWGRILVFVSAMAVGVYFVVQAMSKA